MSKSKRIAQLQRQASILLHLRFSRLVVSAGMPRSASTLLFNIARLCLQHNDGEHLVSGWLGDLPNLPRGRVYLLKTHTVGRLLRYRANRILYSYRDIRDALISANRKFGATASIELCRDYVREYQQAVRYADCIFQYETLLDEPTGVVRKVAACLGVDVDVEHIVSRLPERESVLGGAAKYDKTTLLHKSHSTNTKTGEWRTALATELQLRIREEFGEWLSARGYPLE